jgi:hypothetical protein
VVSTKDKIKNVLEDSQPIQSLKWDDPRGSLELDIRSLSAAIRRRSLLLGCVPSVIVHAVIPFSVSFEAGVAIYEQVVYAAKKAIISGQLRPGDPFPSVRSLSKALKINPQHSAQDHRGIDF